VTQYTNKSFTVNMAQNSAYRDNYDRIFRKGGDEPASEVPAPVEPAEPAPALWQNCPLCGRGHFCPGSVP